MKKLLISNILFVVLCLVTNNIHAQDSDSDGIADSVDLDDDNDGILDEQELLSACSGYVSYEFYDITPSGNTVDNIPTSGWTAVGTTTEIDVDKLYQEITPGDGNNFSIRYSGDINIYEANTYTFYISSDDGSRLYIDGIQIINNDGLHGLVEKSGSLELTEGLHSFEILFFEKGGGEYLGFKYQSSTISKQSVPMSVLYAVNCMDSEGDTDDDGIINRLDLDSDNDGCPDALEGGASSSEISYANLNANFRITGGIDDNGVPLLANGGQYIGTTVDESLQVDECSPCIDVNNPNYVDSDGDLIGDICDLDDDNDGILDEDEQDISSGIVSYEFYNAVPSGYTVSNIPTTGWTSAGTTDEIDVDKLYQEITPGDSDRFSIRYTGQIKIDVSDTYTFYISSDDGSRLYIDGVEIVDNDGLHGIRELGGSVQLTQGFHMFELLFFENTGDEYLGFKYESATISKNGVPMNILYSANRKNLDTDLDGISNRLDLDSDNDGIFDADEAGHGQSHTNGVVSNSVGTDGIPDAVQDSPNIGTVNYVVAESSEDSDYISNYLDIDSDDDGIPDNIEAQPTNSYTAPSGSGISMIDANNDGFDDNYGSGLATLEDTDGDGTPDYLDTDSDNDGTPDSEENGMPQGNSTSDTDNDGLLDAFETNGVNDASWDVNEAIEDPTDLSILPDTDGDLNSGGDLDYRDLYSIDPPTVASVNFDGVDDYLHRASFIKGLNEVAIMAWAKSDTGNSTHMVIAGEDIGVKLWLKNGNRPRLTIKSVGNAQQTIGSNATRINLNEWHHLAGTYTSTTGELKLYVDGELVDSGNVGGTGAVIKNTGKSNGNFEIGRLSRAVDNKQYFKGDIDEVRVFNTLLSQNQIQQMVYQEVEDNSGNIKGSIVPKDIEDIPTSTKIRWSNLIAYYPMKDIKNVKILDHSGNSRDIFLADGLVQEQTAPLPYLTTADGVWGTESTWLHGDVWDIENMSSNKDWSIVKISNDITASQTIKTSALIIDANKNLTIEGDNLIENSWYLELNGTLDLQDDSQLIQTKDSDLVTSDEGKLLRRQEGTASAYWYNYWASPVGEKGVTSLINNNAATNNPNNSPFSLNLLKDDTGFNAQFTSGYTGNGNISTYWLYTFINGVTYWDWVQLTTSTNIKPGVGYTQKGTGIPASEQQYIFEGKPNNGTILIDVTDVGGPGSVPSVSRTEYLLGNPYPSALDINKFIDDNAGVIDGVIQLWQQWSGNSHNLNDYNGGYAQVNKLGSIRASQFIGISGATTGGGEGTIIPSRYLPVGQGFITEIIADGTVEFNNTQRVFIKEADADGTYENGSVFSKSSNNKSNKSISEEQDSNAMKKFRLEFNSVSGPATRRELLLGFSPLTSDAYNYGYDAENVNINNNDLHLSLEGKDMNIQAYSDIVADKVVPLNFKSSGNNTFEIKITEMENIDDSQAIYLKDNFTDTYFDLTKNTAYQFASNQGKFNERFEIVFQSQAQTLSIEESQATENFIYYKNSDHKLIAKKLNASVSRIALVNMLGQTVLEFNDMSQEELRNGLSLSNLSTGPYVVYLRTDANEVLTKKIIVN